MKKSLIGFLLLLAPLSAQWLNLPTPGITRTKDGKPNLAAPTPRTSEGKPDFSGIWSSPGYSTKYLENLAADGIDVRMLPWAAAVYKERQENFGKDRPSTACLPHSVTDFDAHHMPRKVIQTPGVLVILYESYHSFRQIFTDGRSLPKDPDPAWFGYSVGRSEERRVGKECRL